MSNNHAENLFPRADRLREPAQLDALAGLAASFFDELPPGSYPPKDAGLPLDWPHMRAYWAGLLTAESGALWVLRPGPGEPPAGFLQAVVYLDRPTGIKVAAEEYWYVNPASRGDGLLLWNAFTGFADDIQAGFLTAAWSLPQFREPLDKFYQAAGFTQIAGIYMKTRRNLCA